MSLLMALDLATVCGMALWKPGMPGPRYGRWELPAGVGDEIELVFLALRRKMHDYAALESFDGGTVVIEAPLLLHHRDSKRQARLLLGLANEAATTARWFGALPRDVDHQTMMAHWVGHGRLGSAEGKKYSMLAAQARGWAPKCHNAADALGLLDYYAYTWKIEVPWNPRPCAGTQYLDQVAAGRIVGGA